MGKTTISFVATDELADWIEEEAERRMTSRSAAVQQILAEVASSHIRHDSVEEAREFDDHEHFGVDDGDTGGDSPDSLDTVTSFEMPSKSVADALRTEFSEHLSENDDKRLKTVTFQEGTPGEVVEEVNRRSGG